MLGARAALWVAITVMVRVRVRVLLTVRVTITSAVRAGLGLSVHRDFKFEGPTDRLNLSSV